MAGRVLRQIESESEAAHWPIIGPSRGEILDDVVRSVKPKRALEVGTLVGYSAIRIARLLPAAGKLTCLEKNERIAATAISNIEKAGLSRIVEVRIGDARRTIPGLEGRFDLVFLDGAKDEYLSYLELLEDKLRKGSVVVADNVKIHAGPLGEYLRHVRTSGRYRSTYHEGVSAFGPDGDALEVSERIT